MQRLSGRSGRSGNPGRWGSRERDRGSAPVEFVLVMPLLLALAIGVIQLGLVLLVRTTLIAAASQGAAAAAMSDGDIRTATARARDAAESAGFGSLITSVNGQRRIMGGVRVLEVQMRARVPLFGLLGPTGLVATGRAVDESG